jgi:MoxR-like ATPase
MYIFHKTFEHASIENLILKGCSITKIADQSHITNCITKNSALVDISCNGTTIKLCQTDNGRIVNNSADATSIARCQVTNAIPAIAISVKKSVVSDCVSIYSKDQTSDNLAGLIVGDITNDSLVSRCFGTGSVKLDSGTSFGGIAYACRESTIENSAVGRLNTVSDAPINQRRIVYKKDTGSKLFNNIAPANISGQDDPNGLDGKSIADARFSQRYFEVYLGWDFENVWQWDTTNDRPALRLDQELAQAATRNSSTGSDKKMMDLLSSQVRANIWI